jgi:hypothetical protein
MLISGTLGNRAAHTQASRKRVCNPLEFGLVGAAWPPLADPVRRATLALIDAAPISRLAVS